MMFITTLWKCLLLRSLILREEYKLHLYLKRKNLLNNLEEFHDLYRLPSIVRIVKSRRLRWAENGATGNAYKFLWGISVGNS